MNDNIDQVKVASIQEELDKAYFSYAYSVISKRALPYYADGLKPVQRRILLVMWNEKIYDRFKKSVHVVGGVLTGYHPHGDSAVYQAMVRMAQNWVQHIPFIDPQGNFGSIDGYEAAAMRYTECCMSSYGKSFFFDYAKEVCDMKLTYDGSQEEPVALPSRVPNLLINGSYGIAVGVSTSIPTHNLHECLEALIMLINNPSSSLDDVMQKIKGPDLPTGGTIYGDLHAIYEKGEGNVIIESDYYITDNEIVFTSIPYQTHKLDIVKELNLMLHEKKIEGVKSIKDESGRDNPIRIACYLKSGCSPQVVLNQIFSHSQLRVSYRICLFALDKNLAPKVFSLLEFLNIFIEFRNDIIIKRTNLELKKLGIKLEMLIAYRVASSNKEAIINIIKNSDSTEQALALLTNRDWEVVEENVIIKHKINNSQAKSILDLKLQSFGKWEQKKFIDDISSVKASILILRNILENKSERNRLMQSEFQEIINKHKRERKTVIKSTAPKTTRKDLITPEGVAVILNTSDYIKRISLEKFKQQKVGGIGRYYSEEVKADIIASTVDTILFFTDTGVVYQSDVYDIPDGEITSQGRSILNVVSLQNNEKVIKMLVITEEQIKNAESYNIFFITSSGHVRCNSLKDFAHIRSNGKKYMNPDERIVGIAIGKDGQYVFIATAKGMAVRIECGDFRMKQTRNSKGVMGCKLRQNDRAVSGIVADSDDLLFTITEYGLGKLSKLDTYRLTGRGAFGVKNLKHSSKTGDVVTVLPLHLNSEIPQQLMLSSRLGQVIKVSVNDLNVRGRNTSGIHICKLKDPKDKIVSANLC